MLHELSRESNERAVVKSFRITPSDWRRIKKVAVRERMEPSRLVRRWVLAALRDAN